MGGRVLVVTIPVTMGLVTAVKFWKGWLADRLEYTREAGVKL